MATRNARHGMGYSTGSGEARSLAMDPLTGLAATGGSIHAA
jgi:hypothetical protein